MKTLYRLLLVWMCLTLFLTTRAQAVATIFDTNSVIDVGDTYSTVWIQGDRTRVDMLGGRVGLMGTFDASETYIYGGKVSILWVYDTSTVSIFGGTLFKEITNWLEIGSSSTVNIYGGEIGPRVYLTDASSKLNIYCHDFHFGTELIYGGGGPGTPIEVPYFECILSDTSVWHKRNWSADQWMFTSGAIEVFIVPEPMSIVLFTFGGLFFLRRRVRSRK